jgi:PKD repeat protein
MFSKKAQVAFEFIALFGFMFMVFIVMFALVNSNIADLNTKKDRQAMIDLAEVISKEIELATKSEPGYTRGFRLPEKINLKSYTVEVLKGPLGTGIRLSFANFSDDFTYSVPVPHGVFAQNVEHGYNLIVKNESLIVINSAQIPEIALQEERRISTDKESIKDREELKEDVFTKIGKLLGFWNFNQNTGETLVADVSGNNLRGFVQTNDVEFVSGLEGNALQLDGADDSVKVEDSGLDIAESDFSLTAWIKTKKANSVLVAKDSYTEDKGWAIGVKNGKLTYSILGVQEIESSAVVADNKWHNIAIIRDGDKYKFYVDGTLGSEVTSNIVASDENYDLRIGYRNRFHTEKSEFVGGKFVREVDGAFAGLIEDLKIYDLIITPEEVSALFEERKELIPEVVEYPEGLAAYWKFDGNGKDELGNYDGVLTGEFEYKESLFDRAAVGNAKFSFNLKDDGPLQNTEDITIEIIYKPQLDVGYFINGQVPGKGSYFFTLPGTFEYYQFSINGEFKNNFIGQIQNAPSYFHLIFTMKKDGTFKYYLNGKLSYEDKLNSADGFHLFKRATNHNKVDMILGGVSGAENYFVDELKIYSKALNEEGIKEAMQRHKTKVDQIIKVNAGQEIIIGTGVEVPFDASKTFGATQFLWDVDISDGVDFVSADLSGVKPTGYKYLIPGTYTVTLLAKNDKGKSEEDTVTVKVVSSLGSLVLTPPGRSQGNYRRYAPKIFLGPDNNPISLLYDISSESLKFTKCNDPLCIGDDEPITTLPVEYAVKTDITFNDRGLPVISYLQSTSTKFPKFVMGVVSCEDAICESHEINRLSDSNAGFDTLNIENGKNKLPRILWKRGSKLQVTKCNDDTCSGGDEATTEMIYNFYQGDSSSPRFDFNEQENVVMALGRQLSVKTCKDLECNNLVSGYIDRNDPYEKFASKLVLNSEDIPIITYTRDREEFWLVVCDEVECRGDKEFLTKLDSSRTTSVESDMRLDSNDNPVIIYRHIPNSLEANLKFMHCDDPLCKDDTAKVLDTGSIGHLHLELDKQGNPFISYYNGDMRIIRCKDPNCNDY